MRKRLALAALGTTVAALLITGSGTAAHADDHPSPNITGGNTVASAPWGAQILVDGTYRCSGSIIAPQWVLTARFCLPVGPGRSMSVLVGDVNVGSGAPATVTRTETSYGVALLNLDRPIDTSYAKLADADPQFGSENTFYGWGGECVNGICSPSPQLRGAKIQVKGHTRDDNGGWAIYSEPVDGHAGWGDAGAPQFDENGLQVGVTNSQADVRTHVSSSIAYNRAWIRSTAGV